MSDIDKEIRTRIINIITTLIFVITLTWFWFGPRLALVNASEMQQPDIAYLKIQGEPRNFNIVNNSKKEIKYIISLNNISVGCNKVSNNYVTYQLKTSDFESIKKSLALSGDVYEDVITANETKNYSIDYTIDNSSCFTPKIILKQSNS